MQVRGTSDGPSLQGCTVVEIGLDEAGQYAGRLLASLGARVVKIEPLLGEPQRLLAPFVTDRQGRRRSVPYEYLNAGKQSLAADFDDPFVVELLDGLLAGGGAVVTNPGYAATLPEDLAAPVITASTYGAGPKADAPTTTFTRFHVGPSGYLVPAERPLAPSTLAPDCIAGVGLAVTVLGVLAMREHDLALRAPGQPPRADHAFHAHAQNLEKMFFGRVSLDGVELTRESHRFAFGGAVKCLDGHVSMLLNEEHQWRGLCRVMGRSQWGDDERFRGGAGRWRMQAEVAEVLDAWCAGRTVAQVLDAARTEGVPVGAIRSLDQVLGDEVMQARGFLRQVVTPYGPAVGIGLPFGEDPLWRPSSSDVAPLVGQHSRALLDELGHSVEEVALMEDLQLVRCGDAA